jgi:hypothetical protein
LRTQLHKTLVDAFPTLDGLDQFVQEVLHINRARIMTSSGLDTIVDDLLTYCEAQEYIAQLLCATYNQAWRQRKSICG